MSAYAVIIEGSGDSFSGYVPDLPGCVAAGISVDEVTARLREAIVFHIDNLRSHGDHVPVPTSAVLRTIEVA